MSTDGQMDKDGVCLTVEYYSAIKNKILPFGATWMDLECVMLRDISQTEKDKYHIISLTCEV